MHILAIDPGYDRLGIAVLTGTGSVPELLYSECFQTNKNDSFAKRLCAIGEKIQSLIAEWHPNAMALENLFFTTNQKTAMRVAETRGAIIFIGAQAHIPIYEYTPGEIKAAAGGHGKASKDDVRRMLTLLVKIPEKKRLDDEMDAIAVGLTCLARERISTLAP